MKERTCAVVMRSGSMTRGSPCRAVSSQNRARRRRWCVAASCSTRRWMRYWSMVSERSLSLLTQGRIQSRRTQHRQKRVHRADSRQSVLLTVLLPASRDLLLSVLLMFGFASGRLQGGSPPHVPFLVVAEVLRLFAALPHMKGWNSQPPRRGAGLQSCSARPRVASTA